jgi:hypothetical protein
VGAALGHLAEQRAFVEGLGEARRAYQHGEKVWPGIRNAIEHGMNALVIGGGVAAAFIGEGEAAEEVTPSPVPRGTQGESIEFAAAPKTRSFVPDLSHVTHPAHDSALTTNADKNDYVNSRVLRVLPV